VDINLPLWTSELLLVFRGLAIPKDFARLIIKINFN
jgi:hypothetical protein